MYGMYLEKILCAGILLFIAAIILNVATLVTVIKVAHDDSNKKTHAANLVENLE